MLNRYAGPYPQGRSILVARLTPAERYEIWLVITALPVMEWVVAQSSGSAEHGSGNTQVRSWALKRNGRNNHLNRRTFLQAAATFSAMIAAPPLPWAQEKSKLTITAIRLVKTKPKRPYPNYKPDPNSWSTQGVEVSAPLNIYPEFKPSRSLFAAKDVDSFTVEVTTDKGIVGYGCAGQAFSISITWAGRSGILRIGFPVASNTADAMAEAASAFAASEPWPY